MTLYQIINTLKQIALTQPNVKSATDGSVYEVMNTNPSVKYNVVHFSQTTHQSDEEFDYYGLNIFYISRLEDSLEDNRLQIQSIAKEILDNIIRTFCENWNIEFPTITYIPFTQKFTDLCAGAYCTVRIEVPRELICADDFIGEVIPSDKNIRLQDISITIKQNGIRVIEPSAGYDGIGQITINTEVPQELDPNLEEKEVEYTENGSYRVVPGPDYDGISSVSIDVDVPSRYDEGYDDGKQDGEAEQKAKLTVTSFTENNTYTRENGWSAVTIAVPQGQGYEEGYEDGEAAQKAKLSVTSFTENNTFIRENGWSAVTIAVPSDYQDGYDDGVEDQKGKLTTLSVNENGIYTRENGWSAITVTVPQTGSSNADLIANLQGDYYLIPYGTTHLRDYAFYATCFSSITIPTTVSAIGRDSFANNICLTSITIPDSVQYLGTYVFQGDGALETVIIGSGISEIQNRTFSGCRALTGITIPSGVTSIGNSVFDGCSALTEMTFEGLTPPTLGNTGNSLGSTAYTFPIYVPCQSLDAYKTAFGEAYAPRIQCREQEMITAITLNVSSAITDSETATTTYSPSNAYVDYYYTSSNPSIATIDQNTGVITVVANGSVTICTIDRISGLQDCKTVAVTKSPDRFWVIYNVTSTSNRTQILSTDADAHNRFSKMFYNNTEYSISTGFTFPSTGLQKVYYEIADGYSEIGPRAFKDVQTVREVYFPAFITKTTLAEFENCSNLRKVQLNEGLANLASAVFINCTSLSSITIPNSVVGIAADTFYNCTALTSVTIGNNVREIGGTAFYKCSALTRITMLPTTPPTLLGSVTHSGNILTFDDTNNCPIYVPAATVNTYKSASSWAKYTSRITASS